MKGLTTTEEMIANGMSLNSIGVSESEADMAEWLIPRTIPAGDDRKVSSVLVARSNG
jgi:hypothetical protein